MSGNVQPLDLLPQILALMACVLGTWPFLLAYAFGDWKPDGRLLVRRVGHIALFIIVTVVGSESQNRPVMADEVDRMRGQIEGYKEATDVRLRAIEERLNQHVGAPWHQPIYNLHEGEKIVREREVSELRSNQMQIIFWVAGAFLALTVSGGLMIRSLQKTTQRVETTIRQNGGNGK